MCKVIVADVTQPLLGSNFLFRHGFLLDLRSGSLCVLQEFLLPALQTPTNLLRSRKQGDPVRGEHEVPRPTPVTPRAHNPQLSHEDALPWCLPLHPNHRSPSLCQAAETLPREALNRQERVPSDGGLGHHQEVTLPLGLPSPQAGRGLESLRRLPETECHHRPDRYPISYLKDASTFLAGKRFSARLISCVGTTRSQSGRRIS